MPKLKGLYAITDDVLTPDQSIVCQVIEAIEGGAKIIQLRSKDVSEDIILEDAIRLQNICTKYNATFILNDYFDIAVQLQCDGLHIGKSDHHRIEEIRKNFGGILGVSCYGDVDLALQMQEIGADYVAFGSFFASPTKPNSAVVPLEIIKEAKSRLSIPVCAIGGISTNNMHELIDSGVDMLAVISDLWQSEDIAKKAMQFSQTMEKGVTYGM